MDHWFRFNVQRAGWVIGLGLREGWVGHWFRFKGGKGWVIGLGLREGW